MSWNAADLDLLRQLRAEGLSAASIGLRMGRKKGAVAWAIRHQLHEHSKPVPQIGPETVAQLRRLWLDASISQSSIAARLGVSGRTIRRMVDRLELGARPRVKSAANPDDVRWLWATGLSVRNIAIKLGVTKGVVSGLVERLHLSARPSPVKYSDAPIRSYQSRLIRAAAARSAEIVARPQPSPRPVIVPPLPFRPHRARECTWLECDQPVARGSFCAEHAAICYVSRAA